MKILHTVEFYYPSVGGAQEVVRQISEHLVRRGHQVTVATTKLPKRQQLQCNGVDIVEFFIQGNFIEGFRGEVEKYQTFLQEGDFDVMMNYAAQQWASDLAFPIIKTISARKVFAPCGFSGLFFPPAQPYFMKMPEILGSYDALVFHTENYRDIEFARRHGLSNIKVIPNGAERREFLESKLNFREIYRIPADMPLILTVGSHTGGKGHRFVIEAFKRARIGKSYLVIIGNVFGSTGCLPECKRLARWVNISSFGNKRVLLLDPPRDNVVAAFHAADLFVFGSNIECSPIVLFEAMASKTPFVTVACGNADEIIKWSGGGELLPTIRKPDGIVHGEVQDMTDAIERLIESPEARQRLASAGHQAWLDRFTWEKIALEYENLYANLVAGSEPPT